MLKCPFKISESLCVADNLICKSIVVTASLWSLLLHKRWNVSETMAPSKWWITYQFSHALRHNDAKKMTPPRPAAICVISRFLTKSIVFQKCFWMTLGQKKTNCIFEVLSNLYLIVLLINFFPFVLWITTENRTKLVKLLTQTTNLVRTQHHKQANCTWLIISNCNNDSDILDWRWLLSYFWLQYLIQQ